MSRLQLKLFGAFEAALDGVPVKGFRTDKIRALTAYLAVEAERPHARHTLAGLLWPDWPEATALGNLRKSLHRLREALDAAVPGASTTFLGVTPQTVRLDPAGLLLDVAEFRSLVATVKAHSHREGQTCARCMERLTQAVALYRADFLEGFGLADAPAFEEWSTIQREALHQQALGALHDLAELHLRRGAYEAAQACAARQVSLEPWHEGAYRQCMRALALAGRPAEALAQFEACRERLAADLGVEPAADTLFLRDRIAASGRPDEDPGEEAATPSRATQSVRLHHLPPQFLPFVGREHELELLTDLLLDPESRLVTMTGPGGIGKTRLAVEAVRLLAERANRDRGRLASAGGEVPSDLVYFGLAGVPDAELLPNVLAGGLGLTLREQVDARTQLLAYLEAKHILLVLDNFEQLVGGEALVADILNAAPQVRLLITSRRPLALRAERLLQLQGLGRPAAASPSSDGSEFAAVQMFLQTARHILPLFSPSPADMAAILEICELVDGLPLALELAATWLRELDCRAIASGIEQSLDFLATSMHDMPAHHRSMEAVFARSWELLGTQEREVLARASAFRGSFSLEAALAVTGSTVGTLASLIDHSLLHRSEEGHYGIHELTRQFAARRLEAMTAPDGQKDLEAMTAPEGLAQDAGRRHAEYFLALIGGLEPELQGPDPKQAMARLEPSMDNIRQAWSWGLVHDAIVQLARAGRAYAVYLDLAGHFQEGAATFGQAAERARALAAEASPPSSELEGALSDLLAFQGTFLLKIGLVDESLAVAQAAIELAERWQDPHRTAQAMQLFAVPLVSRGSFEAALEQQQRTIEAYRGLGDGPGLIRALILIGVICLRGDRAALGMPYLEEAFTLAKRSRDAVSELRALTVLSIFCAAEGRLADAQAYSRQQLTLARALGFRSILASVLGNRGVACVSTGDYEHGEACLREALALEEAIGSKHGVARNLYNLGRLFAQNNLYAEALEAFNRTVAILSELGNASFYHCTRIDQAEMLARLGHLDAAEEANREGLDYMLPLGLRDHIVQARIVAARLDAARGNAAAAAAALLALLDTAEDPAELAVLHDELWQMGRGDRHRHEALANYREAYGRNPLSMRKRRMEAVEAVEAVEALGALEAVEAVEAVEALGALGSEAAGAD